MPYTPPAWMNMGTPAFGSMAPGGQQPGAAPGLGQIAGQLPQGGLLGAVSSAMQGNPTGGLAKQLFGAAGPQPPSAPGGAPAAPPQMGLLTGLMQKLGMGGAGGGMGGAGGISPTALTGLW